MSVRRIIIGLLIGGLFLTCELAATWYFCLPPLMMLFGLFIFAVVSGISPHEAHRRSCMSIQEHDRSDIPSQ